MAAARFTPSSPRTVDLEIALRAAIGLAVPLLVLLAVGRMELAAYATFGAFTGLYGRGEPYRSRIVTVSAAGAGLLASMALGVAVSLTGAPLAVEAALLVVVLVAGSLLHSYLQAIPGQPLFFCFAFVVTAVIPVAPGTLPAVTATALGGAAFAWLVSLAGWGLRARFGPGHPALFRPLARRPRRTRATLRDPIVIEYAVLNAVGALAAGAIALAIGLGHSYWAVISLVACLPAANARHSPARALHRVIGTAVGVGVAALLLAADLPPLGIIGVAVVCQFLAELLIARNYAATLVVLTPLALLVTTLSSPSPLGPLIRDRLVDTLIGAAVSLALLVLLLPLRRRRILAS
ncbi:hypothetical protein AS850_09670 [Frondihabitans sp. 762G35]|uniref:FUSC family protein n=1 Tax=Frondihabitans sp. 762G35 TaxID=1446794 RepID=UPI000D22533A|nr:FUSC family protein [Frondihabitans sp. 762G35]ARC57343.1 hypothetical protein AS850_09670 [Frondihabitans sp. 762G35]